MLPDNIKKQLKILVQVNQKIWQFNITVRCTFGAILIQLFYKYLGALHPSRIQQ